MGGGESKPPPQPTVIEQDPPAGSGQSNNVYSFTEAEPRLDGISRTFANNCGGCRFIITTGTSGSSVKVTRQFGTASFRQCNSYKRELQMANDKKLSWMDFISNLEAGNYMRDLGNGYCEEVRISAEEGLKVKEGGQFSEDKVETVRIRRQGF